jgi:hypothetical protein
MVQRAEMEMAVPAVAETVRDFRSEVVDRELGDAALVLIDSIQQGRRLDEVIQRFATVASASPPDVQGRVLDFVRESLVGGLLVPRQNDQSRPDLRSESPT